MWSPPTVSLTITDCITRQTITTLTGFSAEDTIERVRAQVQAEILSGAAIAAPTVGRVWSRWYLALNGELHDRHPLHRIADGETLLLVDRGVHCCPAGHVLESIPMPHDQVR